MIPRHTIDEIADKIGRRFQPERIILFGSYARGDARDNSDVDLLVVSAAPAPRGARSAPIIRMLAQEYDLPIDVIVRSPAGLQAWRDVPGSFAQRVAEEGVTLYERPG
jgi:predicted nucleotidyltransferase